MAKDKGIVTIEEIDAAKSWNDLQKLYTFEQTKAALRAKEVQRAAHKKYQIRKSLILERAEADMKANPEKYADIQEELDKLS